LSFGDLSGGSDGGADATSADASNDAVSSDDGATLDGNTGSDGALIGACSGSAGPTMVRVRSGAGSYCIDTTEVTFSQYRLFLAALAGGATLTQPAACAFNTDAGTGDFNPDKLTPVTNVNWCDAYAFCAWAGKRLCGKIGGGSLASTSIGDPTMSQWMRACTIAPDGGAQAYPYGNTASTTACNGAERDAGAVVEVGSLPMCVGGVPGLFDMSGNVDEWDDGCDGTLGTGDCCDTRGGGFHDVETACGIGDVIPGLCPGRMRGETHSDVGFRCCSE
jgi:sulfatase modifying factor 1